MLNTKELSEQKTEGDIDGCALIEGLIDGNVVGTDEGIPEGTVVLHIPHVDLQLWKTPGVLHNVSLH